MASPNQKGVSAKGGARSRTVQNKITDLVGLRPAEDRQQSQIQLQQKKRKTVAGDTPPDAARGGGGAGGPAQGTGVADPVTRPPPPVTPSDITPVAGPADGRGDVNPGCSTSPAPPLDQLIAEAVTAAVQKELQGFRAQLQKDFDELSRTLREHIRDVGRRVGDVEAYLYDAENRITTLEQQVQQRDDMIRGLSDQLDEIDSERRRDTLVFTGDGVPKVAGDKRYDEDVTRTVVDMVQASFPSVPLQRKDIASCYRVGARQTLVVQFVHHGRGSPRDRLYQARFDLMKEKTNSRAIFVNESLSPRRRDQLNTLRTAKKNGQIYTVFTRECAVYYKEKKGGISILVRSDDQLRRFASRGK